MVFNLLFISSLSRQFSLPCDIIRFILISGVANWPRSSAAFIRCCDGIFVMSHTLTPGAADVLSQGDCWIQVSIIQSSDVYGLAYRTEHILRRPKGD